MIRQSSMAGGFIGRTRSNAHKHINKFLQTWGRSCLNKEHKQSWRQHKCSFIEHPLYPGQPIWRAFKIFKFRPSSLSKISINYLAGYFIKISTCFSGPVSSLFLVSLMCHPLQYFSLLWLACDHFFIFFSHFPCWVFVRLVVEPNPSSVNFLDT